jgi:hypothetical protein
MVYSTSLCIWDMYHRKIGVGVGLDEKERKAKAWEWMEW